MKMYNVYRNRELLESLEAEDEFKAVEDAIGNWQDRYVEANGEFKSPHSVRVLDSFLSAVFHAREGTLTKSE